MSDNRLNWFVMDAKETIIRTTMGEGWGRAITYARDALDRPHDQVALHTLLLECSEMARLLITIARDEGEVSFLRDALAAIILDTARREVDA